MKVLSKIKLYDKYIFEQVSMATLVAILLFVVIWIAPEMLLNTIRKALEGAYSIKTAILVIFYELPNIHGKALPVGLLLGSLFTFDKLSKDFELTIFRVAGLSFWRIMAPVLVLSIFVTIICFVTCDKLIPFASEKLVNIRREYSPSQYIYTQKNKQGQPTLAVVVSRFNYSNIANVVVLDFSSNKYSDLHALSNIYVAKRADHYDDKWTLHNVTEYKISDDGIFEEIDDIKTMDILQGDAAKNAYKLMIYSLKRDREIDNKDLWSYIRLLKKEGLQEEYRFMLNKYFQRFTQPLVCILLAIMGCLLGFSKPREQRLIGFTIAIGAIFLYYITLPFFDLLAEKGVLHPFITSTFPPIAFLTAIWAFYKSKDL
ncbi:MAG: LptF/LptG family permease [Candidatus Gastranaerophilales bacterium]|nr:LptF/LptG family permease [Candidatus Gastranaerophilales bacterium]